MQRMMNRQAENTRRVEETIKGTKSNPRWFVPLFCALMIIGLIWAVAYYLSPYGSWPIPNIGAWNLAIAVRHHHGRIPYDHVVALIISATRGRLGESRRPFVMSGHP